MLIDINLLPKKEPRKSGPLIYAAGFLLLAVIAFGVYFWQYTHVSDQQAELERRNQKLEETIAIQNQKAASAAESNSSDQLEKMVEWTESYPVDTVPVLRHLISKLPERGFIQAFSSQEDGIINVTVQFDTSREASNYLTRLTDSAWISKAVLAGVTTQQYKEETDGEEETAENSSKLTNDPYVPRYLAVYAITLNNEVIKADLKKDEAGVSK